MKRDPLPALSEAQLEIMNLIWDQTETTVGQVWSEVRQRRQVSRNTVQTMIARLRDKGWLQERVEGNTYWYRATRRRQGTQKQMVRDLLDNAFAGSAEGLIMALIDSRGLSAKEAQRIREIIDKADKGKKK